MIKNMSWKYRYVMDCIMRIAFQHRFPLLKTRCHAQFGSYGTQTGDGEARISAEKQLKETVDTFWESR